VITDASVIFFRWITVDCKKSPVHLDPSVVVFLEAEIWPNMLRLARRRGTPTLLLSGRFSTRSFNKYAALSWFFRGVLRNFASLGMQSEADANRAKKLGADPEKVFVTGNLKLAGSGSSFDDDPMILESLSSQKEIRAGLLVVGSSHRGEEEMLLMLFDV
jgi:3-deoxy-D-manno-octulosonic-acid transferase